MTGWPGASRSTSSATRRVPSYQGCQRGLNPSVPLPAVPGAYSRPMEGVGEVPIPAMTRAPSVAAGRGPGDQRRQADDRARAGGDELVPAAAHVMRTDGPEVRADGGGQLEQGLQVAPG